MPLTVEQFTERLTSSGLMTDEQMRESLASLIAGSASPTDGDQLARELVKQKRLTKFQAEQLYAGKGNSLTLGNYVILDKLGQGGMGLVLKAQHKRMKRLVALKVMSPAAVKTPDALKRFHREVEAAAKLRHPNIVAADDADEAKGTHFLVMEYVDGSDLSALVKKHGPLPVEQAVRCIIQAARGLEFAHEQGVIHRDIKPANLLIDAKGTVKILDMGLARIDSAVGGSSEGAGLTNTGTIMGTVDYMSPEQAMDTKHADARSDIYSLGCSLYYLLTGHVVYDGDTIMKKLMAHQHTPIPSLVNNLASGGRQPPGSSVFGNTDNATNAPGGLRPPLAKLQEVFQRMVAKRPEDRPQSMTQVIAELERCLSGGSPTITLSSSSAPGGGDALQHFLAEMSGGGSDSTTNPSLIAKTTVKRPKTVVATDSESAATIIGSASEAGTDPHSEQTLTVEQSRAQSGEPKGVSARTVRGLTPSGSPIRQRKRTVILGSVAAAVVVLLAIVFAVRGKSGTLHLEITDSLVEVTIGDTGRVVKGTAEQDFPLPLGEHVLHVKRGDFAFDTVPFEITQTKPTSIKVEQVGRRVQVMMGDMLLGQKELSKPKAESAASVSRPPPLAKAPFNAEQARAHQEAWAEHLGVPVEYTNSIGMKFVLIPPGEFTMGSTAAEIEATVKEAANATPVWVREHPPSEGPQHKVILTQPIYLGIHEVTQAEYEKVIGKNPSYFAKTGAFKNLVEKVEGLDTTSHPVEGVGWIDAAEFCAKLSEHEKLQPFYHRDGVVVTELKGTGYRLPTEAEWEFACGSGTTTRFWIGDKDEDLMLAGWFGLNSGGRTHPVGELKANPFGLFDIHGNVYEWLQDWWAPTYYSEFTQKPGINPTGPIFAGIRRVVRGGFWGNPPSFGRTSSRHGDYPVGSYYAIGFRVSLPVDAVKAEIATGKPIQAGKWLELVPSVDPLKDLLMEPQTVGKNQWEMRDSSLVYLTDGRAGKIKLPVEINGRNLEIEVELTAIEERAGLSIDIPTPEHKVIFHLGTMVKDLASLSFKFHQQPISFAKGKRTTVKLRFSSQPGPGGAAEAVMTVDGKPAIDWRGKIEDVIVPPEAALLDTRSVGLWVDQDSSMAFHSIRVRLSDGNARLLRQPPPAKAPFDAAQARAHQEAWAKHLGTTVETVNSVGAKMILVPPGEFLMGSTSEQIAAAKKMAEDEKMFAGDYYWTRHLEEAPQHPVTITRPFWMGRTEVTVAQFRNFIESSKYVTEAEKYGAGNTTQKTLNEKVKDADKGLNWKSPGYPSNDDAPVTQVSWNDACAFCTWLSEQEKMTPWYQSDGQGGWKLAAQADAYRLPTEAEWEYACRAGTTTLFSFGDDVSLLEQYAWYGKNLAGKPQPVAMKLPNPFGLYDVHGNAWEWCHDLFNRETYAQSSPRDPIGGTLTNTDHVNRGGYWTYAASYCRSAYRGSSAPSHRSKQDGFRCVRTLNAATTQSGGKAAK